MSSNTRSRSNALSRVAGSATAKLNESLNGPGGLTETTNRLLKDTIEEAKYRDVHSRHTTLPAHSQRRGQTDQMRRRAPNEALLSNDWRRKPAMDAGEGLPQVRTNSRYIPAKNFDEAKSQTQNYKGVNHVATRSAMSFHRTHNQENTPFGASPSQSQSTHGNKSEIRLGNSADGGDEANGENHRGDPNESNGGHNKKKPLRQKYFMKLRGLFGPTSGTASDSLSDDEAGILHTSVVNSGTGHSYAYGLADISENAEVYPSESSSAETVKPTVQVQQVNNHQKLKPKTWDNLHDYNYLHHAASVEGQEKHFLPPHLQAKQNDWRETIPGHVGRRHAELENRGSADSMSSDSSYALVEPADGYPVEDRKFQSMLFKLQKNSAGMKATGTVNIPSQLSHSDMTGKSAESDAANHLSGQAHLPVDTIPVGNRVSQRARTLNPTAPEFSILTQPQIKSATVQCPHPAKFSRAPIDGLFDAATLAITTSVPNATEFKGDIKESNHAGLIAGLRTQNMILVADYIKHRQMMLGRLLYNTEVDEIMNDINTHGSGTAGTPRPPGTLNPSSASLAATSHLVPTQQEAQLISHTGNQCVGPAGNFDSQSSHMVHPGVSGVYPQPGHLPGFPAIPTHGLSGPNVATTFGSTASFPPQNTAGSYNGHQFSQTGTAIRDTMQPMNKTYVHEELLKNKPNDKIAQSASAPFIPLGSQSTLPYPIIGPKPVSKPKGPPRPHDPSWNQQQQAYEAYLEHTRTMNPDYHKECRERQLRRADR